MRRSTEYFDPAPVLALQGDRPDRDFARRLGVTRETISRWRSYVNTHGREGNRLYRATAERAALALDRHPLDLWADFGLVTLDEEAWRRRARCKGTHGRYHLVEDPPQNDWSAAAMAQRKENARLRRLGRQMCAECPARLDCLDWVLRNIPGPTDVGIWAGTTRNQRNRMRNARQKVA